MPRPTAPPHEAIAGPQGDWPNVITSATTYYGLYAGESTIPGPLQTTGIGLANLEAWRRLRPDGPIPDDAGDRIVAARHEILKRIGEFGVTAEIIVDETALYETDYTAAVMLGAVKYVHQVASQGPANVLLLPSCSDSDRRNRARPFAHLGAYEIACETDATIRVYNASTDELVDPSDRQYGNYLRYHQFLVEETAARPDAALDYLSAAVEYWRGQVS